MLICRSVQVSDFQSGLDFRIFIFFLPSRRSFLLNVIRLLFYYLGIDCFVFLFLSFRNAYRAEIASFLVPVQGDSAANERIRERIEFVSNILFLIEDLYLTVGPGYMTSQSSVRVNVRSPLYWVRNQLASHVKDLMIAKRTGWQVLKNLKNQVSFSFLSYFCLIVRQALGLAAAFLTLRVTLGAVKAPRGGGTVMRRLSFFASVP